MKNAALLVLFALMFIPLAQGEIVQSYDIIISGDMEPSQPVHFVVTAPVNNTEFSLVVIDAYDLIVFGRDSLMLNETGKQSVDYVPYQAGAYKVKVTFATGIIIERSFLIQKIVTELDIANLWSEIFRLRGDMATMRQTLEGAINIGISISVISALVVVVITLYARRLIKSAASTEWERTLAEQAKKLGVLIKERRDKST